MSLFSLPWVNASVAEFSAEIGDRAYRDIEDDGNHESIRTKP